MSTFSEKKWQKAMGGRGARAAAAIACACVTLAAPIARAEGPAPNEPAVPEHETWTARFERARKLLVGGEYRLAEAEFRLLTRDAPSAAERMLALEMARIGASWAARSDATWPSAATTGEPVAPAIRTKDELSILYASAFLYGAGTGAWYLLQAKPDSALTATLPFAAFTAAPIVALVLIDGHKSLPRGLPHALTAGLYLGLGEGIWIIGYQHARAHRLDADTTTSTRWQGDAAATVLWGGTTLGAIGGGILATTIPTTPGRVSFIASVTTWSGVLGGFAAGAVLPETTHRTEDAMLATGVGYNAGLFGGLLAAGWVSPSVSRVRLVDLSGAAGALASTGLYLSAAHRDTDPRATLAFAAGGAAVGLAVGTLLTRDMPKELPEPSGAPKQASTWQPTMSLVRGGGVVGVGGFM